jgi:hypothetical protein
VLRGGLTRNNPRYSDPTHSGPSNCSRKLQPNATTPPYNLQPPLQTALQQADQLFTLPFEDPEMGFKSLLSLGLYTNRPRYRNSESRIGASLPNMKSVPVWGLVLRQALNVRRLQEPKSASDMKLLTALPRLKSRTSRNTNLLTGSVEAVSLYVQLSRVRCLNN